MKYYKVENDNNSDIENVKYELRRSIYIEDDIYLALTSSANITDNFVEISKEEFDVINESIRLKPAQPEPTETELIQAELLLNQAEILAKQNEQDEVLAEILLNQMGV